MYDQPYSQADHDEAVETGGLLLIVTLAITALGVILWAAMA